MRPLCNFAGVSFLAVLASVATFDSAEAGREKVLYSFAGGIGDGSDPDSRPVMDFDGNLYGTTFAGGANDAGTVFKVKPNNKETVLFEFTGGSDGGFPTGDLIIGSDGNLYGTTEGGGDSGFGTVFQLTPDGTETVLYSFTGGSDGGNPFAGVIMDADGNLYGTTKNGGTGFLGTVYEITAKGKEKVLHSFIASEGADPHAGLILDSDGNLYGTATEGGALNQGTVFKLTPKGKLKVLHSFDGGNDGRFPTGGVILDGDGNFYGAAPGGGVNIAGTVFKLTPKGKLKVLHAFSGSGGDGANPIGSLVMDSAGELYGVTSAGGVGDASVGTVFKISAGGKEKVLHSFDADVDVTDGFQPSSGLIIDAGGALYGVTSEGGDNGKGTVFRVTN